MSYKMRFTTLMVFRDLHLYQHEQKSVSEKVYKDVSIQ